MITTPIKWFCRVLIFVLLLTTVSACQYMPVKVGFIAGLTGANSAVGVDGRDGALLAVDEVNAAGGINGYPIELVIVDNLGTAEGAIAAANQLTNDEGISFIIAHMLSNLMLETLAATPESDALYLSPTVATAKLTGLDDNFLRLVPTDALFAQSLAKYAVSNAGLKTFAIFYDTDNATYSDSYRKNFTEIVTAHQGATVWEYGFASSAKPDFKTAIADMQTSQPAAVLLIASANDTALLAQQIRLEGYTGQLLTNSWALTADLIANGGTAVDGMLSISTKNENEHTPAYLKFAKNFETRFGRSPTFSAEYGYEGILFAAQALKKTKGRQDGLKSALLETQAISGLHGSIALDQYGDALRTMYIIVIREGKFVVANP